jgi:hypothetical protein
MFHWCCFASLDCVLVNDCCLMPNEQFSAILWQEQVTFDF